MFFKSFLHVSALLPLLYSTSSAQTACNNSPSLCSKAYNNITHLGAHDAAFLRDSSTSFSTSGNQYYNATVALDAGVRLLSAQVHKVNSTSGNTEWHLCHTSCDLLDAGTLESWLAKIKTWMDNNSNDVVTILLVNSDNAAASDLGSQFSAAGIDKYAYTPTNGTSTGTSTTWPTLQSLISNNTRLVTFVASLSTTSSEYPYLLDEFTHVFENNYEVTSASNFSCDPNRPTSLTSTSAAKTSGLMFLMNHFLDATQLFGIETPNATYASTTNGQTGTGSLGESLSECSSVYSKAPTFVLVDFWNVGPAISSIDKVNGITATGRKNVSDQALTETSSGVSRQEGSLLGVIVAVVVAVSFGM